MRIIGIDPGINGGAFYFDTNKEQTDKEMFLNDLPLFESYRFVSKGSQIDGNAFYDWLCDMCADLVVIEKPFLTGAEGGQSALTIGSNYGRLLAALDFHPIPYAEVPPKVWQRALGLKGGSRKEIKQSAQKLAVQLFSSAPFLKGKEKKPHDGLTDAACIALYGFQQITEKVWHVTEKTLIRNTQSSAPATGTSAKKSSTSKTRKSKSSTTSKSKSQSLKGKSKASSSKSTQSFAKSKSAGRS